MLNVKIHGFYDAHTKMCTNTQRYKERKKAEAKMISSNDFKMHKVILVYQSLERLTQELPISIGGAH